MFKTQGALLNTLWSENCSLSSEAYISKTVKFIHAVPYWNQSTESIGGAIVFEQHRLYIKCITQPSIDYDKSLISLRKILGWKKENMTRLVLISSIRFELWVTLMFLHDNDDDDPAIIIARLSLRNRRAKKELATVVLCNWYVHKHKKLQ